MRGFAKDILPGERDGRWVTMESTPRGGVRSKITAEARERSNPGVPMPTAAADSSLPLAIVLDDVSFRYPSGTEALRGLSLEVARGTSLGVVGPSGCGKSTLLSLVAKLTLPPTGTVRVASFDSQRHPVSMVFQKDTLLPWLTTRQNVQLYYKFHGGNKAEIATRTAELIQMAGLEGFEDAYPYELSGGMRRRVAFLAGVAPRPEVLLLDEPFSSLDEPTRVGIHQSVFSIVREFEMTMLLVTHDLAEAVSLCDSIVILSAGPGRAVGKHAVPFGDERDMLKLRQTPEFLELYGELWEALSEQIASARARTESGP